MGLFNSKNLLSRIFLACIYVGLYIYIYMNFLYPVYSYMGYEYSNQSVTYNILTIFLSITPIFLFTGINNISSFVSILLYLLAYVPMILTISVYESIDLGERIGYQLILFLAQNSFFYVDKISISTKKSIQIKRTIPFGVLLVFVLLSSIYTFYFYRNNMRFVNFFEASNDLYDLRSMISEMTNQSTINRYLIPWLSRVFYPLLLIIFLVKKKYIYVGIVMTGSFLIFTITAGKLDFFLPFIIIGFYFLLEKRLYFVQRYFFSSLVGLILLLSILLFVFVDTSTGFMLSAIIFMRTISISGYLFAHYVQFFSTHPYTNFAHVNIINAMTGGYPYGERDLGRVVFYDSMNGNANFWIMDGVAGHGIFGVFMVSLILFFLLVFIDRLKTLYDERILYLLFLPIIMTLLNVSLFTTLLTGGGILLVLILYFVKIPLNKKT